MRNVFSIPRTKGINRPTIQPPKTNGGFGEDGEKLDVTQARPPQKSQMKTVAQAKAAGEPEQFTHIPPDGESAMLMHTIMRDAMNTLEEGFKKKLVEEQTIEDGEDEQEMADDTPSVVVVDDSLNPDQSNNVEAPFLQNIHDEQDQETIIEGLGIDDGGCLEEEENWSDPEEKSPLPEDDETTTNDNLPAHEDQSFDMPQQDGEEMPQTEEEEDE